MTNARPFEMTIDHDREIITLQGIRYSFGLFDALAFAPTGARFEIGERRDGVVELFSLTSAKET